MRNDFLILILSFISLRGSISISSLSHLETMKWTWPCLNNFNQQIYKTFLTSDTQWEPLKYNPTLIHHFKMITTNISLCFTFSKLSPRNNWAPCCLVPCHDEDLNISGGIKMFDKGQHLLWWSDLKRTDGQSHRIGSWLSFHLRPRSGMLWPLDAHTPCGNFLGPLNIFVLTLPF